MIEPRIKDHEGELIAIRQDIHAHPELAFEEKRTSEFVARSLTQWGWKVEHGVAGTGVVGTLTSGTGRRSIGVRADMDALPILEATGLPYASKTPGRMHACGHDGHTTILLGAARYLAETRRFSGTVHLIFQPAEEDIGGAQRMIAEGLFEKFPCDAVFAMHNMPGYPVGQFLFREGPIMSAVDQALVTIRGRGGHGAMPHLATDPVVAGASLVMALQSIVSRNVDPGDSAVITVGAFQAGTFCTIIPETARLDIGIRSATPEVRRLLERRIREMVAAQAQSFGCSAEVDYRYFYPSTVNSPEETAFARAVAVELAGEGRVSDLPRPFMASEDFAYMLEKRPGTYLLMGAGDEPERRFCHDPGFDFNDALIVPGASYWGRLVERYLPL